MGPGSVLSGTDVRQYDLRILAGENYPGRRSHAAEAPVPADPEKAGFFHGPYFFRIPPEQISAKRLFCGNKIVLCNDPLTAPWRGEINDELLSRDEIRTNLEWGANLVIYCAG